MSLMSNYRVQNDRSRICIFPQQMAPTAASPRLWFFLSASHLVSDWSFVTCSLLAQLIHSFTTKSDGNFHRKTNSKSLERSERRRNVFQVELFLIVERPARNLPCSSGLLSLGNQKLVSTGILRAGELVPSAIYPRQRQRLSLPIAVPIARAMGARMGRAWSRQCHLAPGKCTGSAEGSTRGGGRCRGQRRRPHRGLNAPLPNEFQSFFFENELMIIILKLIPGFSGLFENVFLCDSSTRNWT